MLNLRVSVEKLNKTIRLFLNDEEQEAFNMEQLKHKVMTKLNLNQQELENLGDFKYVDDEHLIEICDEQDVQDIILNQRDIVIKSYMAPLLNKIRSLIY